MSDSIEAPAPPTTETDILAVARRQVLEEGKGLDEHQVLQCLTIADDRPERAEALAEDLDGVTVVGCDQILDVPCDILAPCGYGHSIRSADVPRLQCRLIAGGEHHPLTRRGEDAVKEAGIVYMPDFAINSAGLIAAATGLDMNQAAERVYQTVGRITAAAEQYGKTPHVVARKMAERRIDLIGSLGGAGTWRQA